MIQLHNISVTLGGQPILNNLTWTIKPGRRIGLIGANGAGKTTLLRLLSGQFDADEGTMSQTAVTGYLAQDVQEHASRQTVIGEALAAFDDLEALQSEEEAILNAMVQEKGSEERLLRALDRIHTALETQEAHLIRPRTEAVLLGLGFETSDFERPLDTLSGGYRMRVVLAQILLRKPDVLLLDEPTNHLDIVSIGWLENYLKSYPGTVVLVSHDRTFLNRMVTSIAHLRRGQIVDYAGNYDFFLEERARRRVLEQAAYENQQREIAQTERFINRFRYKSTKARQVQSRVKYLEKLVRLLPPESEEAQIRIRFPVPRASGRVVLSLSSFSKRYPIPEGGLVSVFENAGPLTIERGDKIALVGKNGAGKSTLARILDGTEAFEGTRKVGYKVDTGFFAQHQAETLSTHHTALDSLKEVSSGYSEQQLRTLLGAFLFTGDDVFKTVQVLSGGEKSRLALARTLIEGTNFLILDEPTNHLDIPSIQVLIEALKQYEGTFIVVSHDRHFLNQVANSIWHAESGDVRVYKGTWAEYQWRLTQENGTVLEPSRVNSTSPPKPRKNKNRKKTSGPKSREQKRREAEARNRAYRAKKSSPANQIQVTEEAIESLEARRSEIEHLLGKPEVYESPSKVSDLGSEHARVQADLGSLYQRWETLMESE